MAVDRILEIGRLLIHRMGLTCLRRGLTDIALEPEGANIKKKVNDVCFKSKPRFL